MFDTMQAKSKYYFGLLFLEHLLLKTYFQNIGQPGYERGCYQY